LSRKGLSRRHTYGRYFSSEPVSILGKLYQRASTAGDPWSLSEVGDSPEPKISCGYRIT